AISNTKTIYVNGTLGSVTLNPDVNGNGAAVYPSGGNEMYQGGMFMDALVASKTPSKLVDFGPLADGLRTYGDAVQDILAALQSSPAQAGNARAVARELNRRGRYGEAKDVTLALLRLDPNDPSAHFELARAENGLGHRAVALAELRQAAALDPAYRAKSDAAQAAGESQDLSFLFDEPGAAGAEGPGRTAGADAQRRRSIGFLVLGIAGGFIVALGLLELLLSWRGGRGAQEEAAADAIEAAVPAEAYSRIAGPRFRDAYGIIRQLGVGGMGVVYEAVDQALGRRVAVKKMRDEIRADPRERERFLKEARTVAALRHPGIVAIHSIVEDGEDVYLIFEYVDGETLYHLLDRRGRLGLEAAAVLIEKAAQALGYAHDHGIIHRDLKLSNIMLSAAGEVKVMDFGIARQAKDAASRLSTTGSVAGTPPYMAPEQEHGLVCRESDIYSLAVCFYELLTGNLPFQGSAAGMLMNKMNKSYAAPSRLAPELPGAVDEFFAAAFEPEPTRRFRTVQDFVHALRQAAAIV
ncbi:MAG: protein kinase, partial [Elusimicrobia bacterium]|nr:protein kinase [Elusimicrobiota bacterium]